MARYSITRPPHLHHHHHPHPIVFLLSLLWLVVLWLMCFWTSVITHPLMLCCWLTAPTPHGRSQIRAKQAHRPILAVFLWSNKESITWYFTKEWTSGAVNRSLPPHPLIHPSCNVVSWSSIANESSAFFYTDWLSGKIQAIKAKTLTGGTGLKNMSSFRLVERKHPKYTFYCTSSICICRFQLQYISLKRCLFAVVTLTNTKTLEVYSYLYSEDFYWGIFSYIFHSDLYNIVLLKTW